MLNLLLLLVALNICLHEARGEGPPIIDIGSLWNSINSQGQPVVHQLEEAFQTHGVAVLKGVNISSQERISYFNAVQELMQLEEHDKLSVRVKPSQAIGRGYLPFGSESGLAEFIEPKEGYSYGYPDEHTEHNKLTSPNIWPAGLSQSSIRALSNLFTKFSHIANLLVHSIASYRNSLNVPTTSVSIESDKGAEISLLRIFHYFHTQSPQYLGQSGHSTLSDSSTSLNSQGMYRNAIGSSPHTDWGLLTLILPNHVTGLQYIHNYEYVDVPYIPDTIIVNAGDFFSLATKGEYHSPIHRVLCPVNENRMSFVYFFYPNYDTLLTLPASDEQLGDQASCTDSGDSDSSALDRCGSGSNGVCEAAGKKCSSQQEQYNTLLSKHMLRGRGGEGVKFGDYILEKWEGVTRTGY